MSETGWSVWVLLLAGIPGWWWFWRSALRGTSDRKLWWVTGEFPDRRFGLVDVGLFFLISQLAASLGSVMGTHWFPPLAAEPEVAGVTRSGGAVVLTAGAQLIGVAIGVGAIALRQQASVSTLFGVSKVDALRQLGVGGLAFLMVVPPILLIHAGLSVWIPYQHPTLTAWAQHRDPWMIWGLWLSAGVAAPVYEECFYRGIIQAWWQRYPWRHPEWTAPWILGERYTGTGASGESGGRGVAPRRRLEVWLPIVVTSALFAAMHVGQGAAPVALFLLSVALGYLYRYTGSVIPCLVVHGLLNGMTLASLTG